MNQSEVAELIEGLVRIQFPQLREAALLVSYSKRNSYLYSARRGVGGVVLDCGVPLDHPHFMRIVKRAAQSTLEVLNGSTSAVIVRLTPEGLDA